MTTKKPHSAGDEIDSRCTKCKGTTNHMIIAMVGDEIAKVQCNSCGSRHNYRPPAPTKGNTVVIGRNQATSAAKTPKQKKASRSREILPPLDPAAAIPYTMNCELAVNDIVDHTTFGLGLVTATTLPNKIEILFNEGKKILIGKPKTSLL